MRAETKMRWAIVGLLALTILSGIMTAAHAQGTCTAGGQSSCFIGSKTTGESPLSTVLTWNVVGATTCTAGGAGTVAAWSGSIPCSGTRTLTGIGVKMTLTIDPVGPATAGKMRLTWTPPMQNTDGTALTQLGGYVISYGTAAGALNQTINLAVPGANAYDLTALTAGTWFASIQAATTTCFPAMLVDCHVSLPSNITSKAVTTTPGGALPQLQLPLEPYQVPKPPTNLTATDAIAFDIRPDSAGKLLAQRIGVVRPGTLCASEGQQVVGGVIYSLVDRSLVDIANFTNGPDAWVTHAYAKCSAGTVDL